MTNKEQQIFNKLVELSQEFPTIDFDTFEESGRYEGVYYTRGVGEALEEWDIETELADVTIYWDPKHEEAELIIEPYED